MKPWQIYEMSEHGGWRPLKPRYASYDSAVRAFSRLGYHAQTHCIATAKEAQP